MNQKPVLSSIDSREEEGFPVFVLRGYFEDGLARDLVAIVERTLGDGRTAMILDFSSCSAMNSLAVGQLQSLTMRIVEDFQGTLVLVKISSAMERVFELASIIPWAQKANDVAEAIARIRASE